MLTTCYPYPGRMIFPLSAYKWNWDRQSLVGLQVLCTCIYTWVCITDLQWALHFPCPASYFLNPLHSHSRSLPAPVNRLLFSCPLVRGEANDYPASCFLDRNFRYKSVATQIPHDAQFAPIPYTGRKILPHRRSNCCSMWDPDIFKYPQK